MRVLQPLDLSQKWDFNPNTFTEETVRNARDWFIEQVYTHNSWPKSKIKRLINEAFKI